MKKIINKIKDAYWHHKRIIPPLRNHKFIKELAEQLLYSLENDLKYYCKDKNIELKFDLDTHRYTIDIEVVSPSDIINQKLNNDELDGFDLEIIWIVYEDVLWTILHYQEELEVAYKRIDYVLEKIYKN